MMVGRRVIVQVGRRRRAKPRIETVKAIGLTIADKLLALADEVIE
jgi:hypothetical protein